MDRASKNILVDSVSTLAIFTGLIADLLAIIPFLYNLSLSLASGTIKTQETLIPKFSLLLPIDWQYLSFVLIFYALVAFYYWLHHIFIPGFRELAFVRLFSSGLILIAGIPLTFTLIASQMLSLADGFAILSVLVVMLYYALKYWKYDGELKFTDVGFRYVFWSPAVWAILQYFFNNNWFQNFWWAYLYCASGYVLLSLLIGISLIFANIDVRYRNKATFSVSVGGLPLIFATFSVLVPLIFYLLPPWLFWSLIAAIVVLFVYGLIKS